jgi:acyl dehydratase
VADPERPFFEDIEVGDEQETPAITVTEAHVDLYLGLTRELSVDPTVVPDLLPLCLSVGLAWRAPRPPTAVLAFMGCEWQTVRPLRVGDTIHSRSRTVTKRTMREAGVIVEEREILDQHDEVVQRGRFTYLVAKRPRTGAA